MGTEIERKFLVRGDGWRSLGTSTPIQQGYLSTEPERTVRVRRAGERAFLTVKGTSEGIRRVEVEVPISVQDAHELLALCLRPVLEKTRTRIELGPHVWEVDEFFGDNRGLIVAEIELADEAETFVRPDWIGDEVSDDPRYFNANLLAHPFTRW